MITLTINQLEEAVPFIHYKRLELILPSLNYTLNKYNINSITRVAHFLTQLIIESNYFRHIQELGVGEEYELSEVLGNTERGDGRRFISRGYIKILGRNQYTAYKEFSNIDIVGYPHYVTTPKVAMDISGWIWNNKLLNILADKDDLLGITKLLKGEYVLIREREIVLKRVKKAIGLS